MRKKDLFLICLIAPAMLLFGCMSWSPGWQQMAVSKPGADVAMLLEEADQKSRSADDRSKLLNTIETYEAVIARDLANFRALSQLGHLYILLGAAYTEERSKKASYYKKAIQYNEQAMYTNADFKGFVDKGESVWDASRALNEREMGLMGFWTNGIFYYYKECTGPLGKIINYKWIKRTTQVMERMTEIDPDWGEGGLHFSWGIYYLALPERVGGDKQKSKEYLAKAIQTGPKNILNRWGRAKYFHVLRKDRTAFREDLEWVIAQDPHQSGLYAWNIYFQRDAREMLSNIDRYF